MASIKISELPPVTTITDDDVLLINDEDSTTSKITISNFTTSFINQTLAFTGKTSYSNLTTFSAGSVPVFDSDATFNQRVVFNGPITLGSLALIPLGDLSDVTLPATIPNGQVLTWDNANGYWTAAAEGFSSLVQDTSPELGGNLDLNGYKITSDSTNTGAAGSNIVLAPDATGKVIVEGNTAAEIDGSITLNCYVNTHGVTIKAPPHSDGATYTLILPASVGTAGQVLSQTGTGQLLFKTLVASDVGAATAAQGATADSAMQVAGPNVIPAYADDAAAAAGGVAVGGLYRIGSAVQVRVS